jgi:hypothetical protein
MKTVVAVPGILAALVSFNGVVSAQAVKQAAPAAAARTAATAASAIPRTPDGKPDMQGYWTNQTFTPVERPAELKDKAFFTAEEAMAWAKRGLDRLANQDDSVPHYDDSIWMLEGYRKGAMLRTSIVVDPPDGRIPPLNAEGQKRAQQRAAARKQMGGAFDSAQNRGISERCIYWAHQGPPLMPTGYNSNLQIWQEPGHVVVIPEMMPMARVIPVDGRPHLPAAIRPLHGDSRGQWEGDTFVVETTNVQDRSAFRGASENLKVVERFTLVDPDTIRYQFTVADPSTWDRPWSGEYQMTRIDGPLYEYACHEGNYGIVNILRGARQEEAAAAGSTK